MVDRAMIVGEARRWIGTPYRHGSSIREIGCDCVGLVRGVWRAVVGPEPERAPAYARDWAAWSDAESLLEAAGRHLVRVPPAAAVPGDVLIFRWRPALPAQHCAILVEPVRIVHAYDIAGGVTESNLAPSWRHRRVLVAAFAFPGAC